MNKSLNFAVIGVGLLATMLALYMIAASNFAACTGRQYDWCCRRQGSNMTGAAAARLLT